MGTEVVEIHRSRQADNYTILPNEIIRDTRLDPFTLGVLTRILSNTPDWHATADTMWHQAGRDRPGRHGEGRDIYRRTFRELERAGYLVRTKIQGPGGKWITRLDFYDTPRVSPGHAGDGLAVPGVTRDDVVSAGGAGDCSPVPGVTRNDVVSAGGAGDWISGATSWDSANAARDPGPGTQASTKRTIKEELPLPSVEVASLVELKTPPRGTPRKRPSKHATADDLAAKFWERHKTSTAQGFLAIRAVIRTAMANEIPRNDLACALDLLAREGTAISGGSVQTALKILRDRKTGGRGHAHESYRNPPTDEQSRYDTEELRPA